MPDKNLSREEAIKKAKEIIGKWFNKHSGINWIALNDDWDLFYNAQDERGILYPVYDNRTSTKGFKVM